MEDFITKMTEKTGIDKATALKVVGFLKDHSTDAIALLQKTGVASKLPGGVGAKVGDKVSNLM